MNAFDSQFESEAFDLTAMQNPVSFRDSPVLLATQSWVETSGRQKVRALACISNH